MCELYLKLMHVAMMPLLITLNRFHTLLWCFYYYFEQVNVGWLMGKYLLKVNNNDTGKKNLMAVVIVSLLLTLHRCSPTMCKQDLFVKV